MGEESDSVTGVVHVHYEAICQYTEVLNRP